MEADECRPHRWDGLTCSVCGMARPIRPPSFERQPVEIEPTRTEREEGEAVARLIGYLNVYLSSETASGAGGVAAVTAAGEIVAWQLAAMDNEDFLAIARGGAQAALSMSPGEVRDFCRDKVAILAKHRYFLQGRESQAVHNLVLHLST